MKLLLHPEAHHQPAIFFWFLISLQYQVRVDRQALWLWIDVLFLSGKLREHRPVGGGALMETSRQEPVLDSHLPLLWPLARLCTGTGKHPVYQPGRV